MAEIFKNPTTEALNEIVVRDEQGKQLFEIVKPAKEFMSRAEKRRHEFLARDREKEDV